MGQRTSDLWVPWAVCLEARSPCHRPCRRGAAPHQAGRLSPTRPWTCRSGTGFESCSRLGGSALGGCGMWAPWRTVETSGWAWSSRPPTTGRTTGPWRDRATSNANRVMVRL
ncbi:hypothetical protein JZ751_029870 [Albula glossodonta]|uniref:Uncharacterized protein n=1 Tax=Albula glossodonta TaxID=121402 RepID=A0A8T2MZB5_9TELE|nr:hypothetical protein JZ751_029870 [Albula glossodonta]